MKSTKISAVLILFALAAASEIHAACTNATAAGTYGFATNGTLFLPIGPTPVTAVGVISFDLNGNANGSQDRSVGGAFAHETITGVLAVNHDCTTTLEVNVYDSNGALVRTSTIRGVFVNNGKQIRSIFESVVLPNGVSLSSVLSIEAIRVQGHSD